MPVSEDDEKAARELLDAYANDVSEQDEIFMMPLDPSLLINRIASDRASVRDAERQRIREAVKPLYHKSEKPDTRWNSAIETALKEIECQAEDGGGE